MKSMSPNNSGNLVEESTKVSVNKYVQEVRKQVKEELLIRSANVLSNKITLSQTQTGFGGTRYWFNCPICTGRIGTVYVHQITKKVGCRKCLGLEYRSRRYKGMVEMVIGKYRK